MTESQACELVSELFLRCPGDDPTLSELKRSYALALGVIDSYDDVYRHQGTRAITREGIAHGKTPDQCVAIASLLFN